MSAVFVSVMIYVHVVLLLFATVVACNGQKGQSANKYLLRTTCTGDAKSLSNLSCREQRGGHDDLQCQQGRKRLRTN